MLGEETVLLKALEGKRGQPEQRPPQPATRGLFGLPTVVQNVQTLAAVPWILANGAEAFAAIGSKASPGTILVSVRARRPAPESPRSRSGRRSATSSRWPARTPTEDLKAILVGGPSGGILPRGFADTAVRVRGAPCRRRPHRLGLDRRRRSSAPASSTWPGS